MNTKMKRRMIAVSGVIIVVLIVVLAVVGGNTAAKSISVSEAAEGSFSGSKVQVSGNVVPNSYSTEGNTLNFDLYDPSNPSAQINVIYDGSLSSTFGNDVTAICTGRMGDDDVLYCMELITKCPSKYESGTDALTVERLLGYGENMIGTTVKVSGVIGSDSLGSVGEADRFVIVDPETDDKIAVHYEGALPNDISDGSAVVLTGAIGEDGRFIATDVSMKG